MLTWFTRPAPKTWPVLIALSFCGALPSLPAAAQAIAATVNGDPITTTEVDEQMKMRRVLKEPSTRDAALEDLVADRIKLRQANRNGIDATEAAVSQVLNQMAQRAKTSSNLLVDAFQKQKVNIELVRAHLHALAAWNEYVRARNKSLSVSDNDITAALAANASLGKGLTDYQLQQVVFVIPAKSPPGLVEQRMREAQALRSRFSDCASGLPLARALPDVAVKPPISKVASALPEATRKAIEETGKGHLTPPDHTASGIEMIAVCGTDEDIDQSSIRDSVQQRLLADRLIREGDRLYKDLRATAVVDKR